MISIPDSTEPNQSPAFGHSTIKDNSISTEQFTLKAKNSGNEGTSSIIKPVAIKPTLDSDKELESANKQQSTAVFDFKEESQVNKQKK